MEVFDDEDEDALLRRPRGNHGQIAKVLGKGGIGPAERFGMRAHRRGVL
jgi:hypothetical protein